jgi:adenylate kinase
MYLILLGAPGSGKGTQGSQLADRLAIPKIATGDILRAAVRDRTELGLRAKSYMDAGELVPDALILDLVREVLADPSSHRGAIFDGFPRTVPQAERLTEILESMGRRLDAVVVLEVPDEAIVERMSGRRTDPDTGQVYHLVHNPPPADIADRLTQRPDDREDTVRHRLSVYARQTEPLIAHYENDGVRVHRVDGTAAIEKVQQDILSRLST